MDLVHSIIEGGNILNDNRTVSIIVPIYNTAPYLSRCIDSIIGQSYRNIELLLIDDGSTDNSLEICLKHKAMDRRIQVLHKENGGVCSARNLGLQNMHGDYFLFVDSDDALETSIIEQAMDVFKHYSDTDLVVFGWKKIYENGTTENYLPENEFITDMSFAIKHLLEHYNGYGGGYPNKMWKTSAFSAGVPLYDENLYYFEDMEWMTRMFLGIKSFACLRSNGYLYHIRGDSTTFRSDNSERKERGYHMSALQIIDDLNETPEIKVWFQERYYPELVNGVLHAWKHHQSTLGKWLLAQLQQVVSFILLSQHIPWKIKIRCLVLHIVKT